ncbi:hypothetical protein Goshw_016445 [Gossypium schwendimanii]|uniref:Protein kinase domain-containing protein n=1 Tax=Gossypium schwendimanii TaxID=34291 RepID=A0A7J9LA33_GOSSC|nr:hypothetical protein [Gossypium schwendimanii]
MWIEEIRAKICSCGDISVSPPKVFVKLLIDIYGTLMSHDRKVKWEPEMELNRDRPGRKGPPLSWAQRLKIAVDVARGLNYLHFDRAVPHGNLKAMNILLDGPDLNSRVADYCLHRLMTQAGMLVSWDIRHQSRCAGDVILGEEEGIELIIWVRLKVVEGSCSSCFDSALAQEIGDPSVKKGMKEVLEIGLRSVRSLSERPDIKTIYEDLFVNMNQHLVFVFS